MSNIPAMDARRPEDIMKAIEQKARIYTPEWNYEPGVMDGGAALAMLFSQMFSETTERLNRVPYKHYIEFLNILEVSARSMTPATGMAIFELSEGNDKRVVVKNGTQMYCDLTQEQAGNDDSRVIFETAGEFYATPAKLIGIYSVNPKKDIIEKLDLEQSPARFFDPSEDRNMQRHFFAISSSDTLLLRNPADITLRLENTSLGYLNEEYISQFADPSFAQWFYYDGSRQIPFKKVFTKDGRLHLIKDNDIALMPHRLEGNPDNREEKLWISCEMTSIGRPDEIVMNRILIGSAYLHKEKQGVHISPDNIYANDNSIDPEDGGYCFGKQPMAYDCLYISSDEVFSKCDARVNIEFSLKTVVRQIGDISGQPQYNFNRKYIVEKAELPVLVPDRIFVSRISWEYWNGTGWTHLKVEGDHNPFDGQEGTFKKQISFQCPGDIEKSLQNSIEGYWIRARVVEVENAFSTYAQICLPYVEAISLDFDYMGALKNAEAVYTQNNCEEAFHGVKDSGAPIMLYQPLKENVHSVYLAFDLPPAGYPVNLYIRTEGQSKAGRLLSFEYLGADVKAEGVWNELKVIDRTESLEEDGIISIYAPQDFIKSTIFGQEAYWIRIVDKNLKFAQTEVSYPVVRKIIPNVVEIIQKQTILKEMFYTDLFESNKQIILANRPVLDCQVWVNELSDISKAEMTFLSENKPHSIDIQYNNSGQISEFWVKWERCDSFMNSDSGSRKYKLDSYEGKIAFGDGKHGKAPSAGDNATIMVNYSFGGGERGNLAQGSIEGLIVSLPYVDRVTNLEMTCGGSDQHDIKTLERVGPQRLRHRGRAVTASDFESIVLEQFSEIRDVKCVPNYNRLGQQAWGYVTLVLMPFDIENRSYSLRLCKKIEQYLSNHISCELLEGGRFAVVPAIVMKVSATISITVDDYEFAAETEMQILGAVSKYLDPGIDGDQRLKIEEFPTIQDFYSLLKRIKNISGIQEVILEGRYYDGNVLKIVPLDVRSRLKYAVVANGEHTVKIL